MKTIVNYAQKVKEQHALNKTLAPVETDLTDASRSYAIGEQFINDGDLFKAKTPIAQHDALVLDTNYEAADDITTQIKNKTVTTDPVPTDGSTNPVQSNGVYVENRNIYAVMGKNGAKNKEPFDIDVVKALNTTGTWTGNSYELNGITFAFADDGKVTVSGTASALCSINISGNYDLNGGYIITGCPSGGGASTYSLRIYDSSATVVADDVGEGISFTANNLANCRTNIIVRKNAAIATPIVFAPMIRDSKDTDATYQPYAKTNQQLTAENQTLTNKTDVLMENGAINMLPNNATTQTDSGVTFTVNSDKTVTLNGTATAQINFPIKNQIPAEWIGKSLKLTGCIGGSSDKYELTLWDGDESRAIMRDYGNGAIGIPLHTNSWVNITIRAGATFNNVKFKPMISDASLNLSYDDYVPYAKTNRELTENIITQTDVTFTPDTTKATVVNADLYREGKHIRGRLDLKVVNTAGGALGTFNKASAYVTPMYAYVGDRTTIDNQPANSYINKQSLVVNPVNAFVVYDRIQIAIDFYIA